MAELTAADVELYTKGRLSASSVETYRLLQRALAAARGFCEWHVTPVRTETVTIDGPGSHVLMLPTLNLVTLNTITENGVALTVSDLQVSTAGPVRVRKRKPNTGFMFYPRLSSRWTYNYSGIVVNMTHGYVEAEADDFRVAVLDCVDRLSQLTVQPGNMKRYRVDDVDREWYDRSDEVMNKQLLESYRLLAPY